MWQAQYNEVQLNMCVQWDKSCHNTLRRHISFRGRKGGCVSGVEWINKGRLNCGSVCMCAGAFPLICLITARWKTHINQPWTNHSCSINSSLSEVMFIYNVSMQTMTFLLWKASINITNKQCKWCQMTFLSWCPTVTSCYSSLACVDVCVVHAHV